MLTSTGRTGSGCWTRSAQFASAPRVLDATWEATLTPGLVAAFARGRAVPELWGQSTGTATLDLEARRLELDTSSRFEGRNWADFDPRLAEVSDLRVEADVAGELQGGIVVANRLRIGLTPAGGREILRLEALQPVTLDLERWEVVPETWGEPALRIEMDRYPLRWTRGFDPAVVVEDGDDQRGAGRRPRQTAPRRAGDSRADPGERPAAQCRRARGFDRRRSTSSSSRASELDAGSLRAQIERFEMTADTGLDVRFTGGVATSRDRWPVLAADGDLVLRIPKLRRALESLDAVRGGARFELDLARMMLLLDRAELDATSGNGHPMVAVTFDNEIPLKIALPAMRPDWRSSETQELRVRFDGLPISWVSPFIPEIDLAAGALFGELVATTGGGLGVTLEPVEPFQVRGLEPVYRGVVITSGATASLEPRLRLDNTGASVSLDDIQVRTPSGGRLDGQVVLEAPRDGRRRIATEVRFEADFPTISSRIGRLGALSWWQRGTIDVAHRRVEVSELEVGLTDLAGTRFLELSELRPFVSLGGAVRGVGRRRVSRHPARHHHPARAAAAVSADPRLRARRRATAGPVRRPCRGRRPAAGGGRGAGLQGRLACDGVRPPCSTASRWGWRTRSSTPPPACRRGRSTSRRSARGDRRSPTPP